MHKCISIDYITQYCSSYSNNSENSIYFFDLKEYKVYSKYELIKDWGFEEEDFCNLINLEYEMQLIPVCRVNIIDEIRSFLLSENNRKLSNKISNMCNMSNDEVYVNFQKLCDYDAVISSHWNEYIERVKTHCTIKWCKDNNIIYRIG